MRSLEGAFMVAFLQPRVVPVHLPDFDDDPHLRAVGLVLGLNRGEGQATVAATDTFPDAEGEVRHIHVAKDALPSLGIAL